MQNFVLKKYIILEFKSSKLYALILVKTDFSKIEIYYNYFCADFVLQQHCSECIEFVN